jgi:RNA methyltransferase, TrmH family
MIIQSLINPKIKHLVALQKSAYRKEHKQFIAQGAITYSTLLKAGCKLHSVYVTAQAHDQHHEILAPDTMFEVTPAIMEKISTTTTATGIVALFEIPESKENITQNSIVLHNIQDPGNLGTLIRTAAAMKIDTVVLMQGVDPYHPKVVQSTAGTIGCINIVQTNWPAFYKAYKTIPMCALVVEGGESPDQINLKQAMLCIGNEGQGLPPEIIAGCSMKMTIEMPGQTESLNAAVAGSIAMYLKSKN